MKNVDLYGRVRHAVLIDGMSSREAARVFGVDPRTIAKMLAFSFPPGYRRSQPVRRPKLDAFTGIIDQTLEADKLVPKKQRHTSKRIFERLRDEHDFEGGITIVKDYIFAAKQRQREMFVPLSHPPGHAQADFDEGLHGQALPREAGGRSRQSWGFCGTICVWARIRWSIGCTGCSRAADMAIRSGIRLPGGFWSMLTANWRGSTAPVGPGANGMIWIG